MNSREKETAPVVSGNLSYFYWLSAAKVSIVLTCGAASGVKCLQILKSGKNRLRFCASGPSLSELIGYENLMDCLEILPEDSLGIKHKNSVGELRFSKLISRNGLCVNTCRCIFGHRTWKKFSKITNRNIENPSHHVDDWCLVNDIMQ